MSMKRYWRKLPTHTGVAFSGVSIVQIDGRGYIALAQASKITRILICRKVEIDRQRIPTLQFYGID